MFTMLRLYVSSELRTLLTTKKKEVPDLSACPANFQLFGVVYPDLKVVARTERYFLIKRKPSESELHRCFFEMNNKDLRLSEASSVLKSEYKID